MKPTRFNVRVYGIWLHEGKVLVSEELIKGNLITKFPGGGLDLGEGILDGLRREWQEELGLDIEVLDHFYTTHFFQPSAFDDSQVLSIYYRVQGSDPAALLNNLVANERTYWKNLDSLSPETFQLPIDKYVGERLQDLFANNQL